MKNRLKNINLPAMLWAKYTASLGQETPSELIRRIRDFTDGNPCILECCCGKGEFLSEEAKKHPGEKFIGVDYSYPVLQRAVKRAAEAELDNVLFLHNSIEDLFEIFRESVSFKRIYINFSDPWPKKKHWKRRVVQKKSLVEIHSLMDDDTMLFVVTDHEGYRDWISAVFKSLEEFFLPEYGTWYVNEMSEFHESDYMNKGMAKGFSINYFVVKKR